MRTSLLTCLSVALGALLFLQACNAPAPETDERVSSAPFGQDSSGEKATVYTLRNHNGMEARVTNYGGIILSLTAPDRNGNFEDVTIGYDSLSSYLDESPYFGAIIGRYGNRIANGRFTLDGQEYTLATNNGPNSLHGGNKGFDKVFWNAEPFEHDSAVGLVLTRRSPDMEEGYPGNLDVKVTYALTDNNELRIDYEAETDKATPVNLTQHTYFNLTGDFSNSVLDHELMIDASRYTPVDSTLIPTGELVSVEGTPFDFRTATPIGERVDADDDQIRNGPGYDHNWVLDRESENDLELAARLIDPSSGRVMEILTTEPGLQFYSGNFLDGTLIGRGGKPINHRTGVALETQHFPDSPNQSTFPSTILQPGDTYQSTTVYRFTTTDEGQNAE